MSHLGPRSILFPKSTRFKPYGLKTNILVYWIINPIMQRSSDTAISSKELSVTGESMCTKSG